MGETMIPARVMAIAYEAEGVLSFLLARADGAALPPVDPGAHIDIALPGGLLRSYSLSNYGETPEAYRLTVALDAASRGGSRYLHEQLRAGALIGMSLPRNNFALAEEAPLSIFIAGGIGVTPFLPMIARLNARGRPWRLHYCVRTENRAALLGELRALAAAGQGVVLPHFDGAPGAAMLDLDRLLRDVPPSAHVYCCGPAPMLDAYRAGARAAGIEEARVHFEYFKAEVVQATEGGFTVVCEKSGVEAVVAPGRTILDAVTALGIAVPFSCEEGVCGSCETRVISGEPDHRDMILSDHEKAESRTMMICCSGSKSARLVLDL